ncbi:MAG: hypothetical protein ACE5IJ_03345 [Thermoplasmata archaeon]
MAVLGPLPVYIGFALLGLVGAALGYYVWPGIRRASLLSMALLVMLYYSLGALALRGFFAPTPNHAFWFASTLATVSATLFGVTVAIVSYLSLAGHIERFRPLARGFMLVAGLLLMTVMVALMIIPLIPESVEGPFVVLAFLGPTFPSAIGLIYLTYSAERFFLAQSG